MTKGPAVDRRIPQRTCLGCWGTRGKQELIRLVRTPEAAVVVDPTGKRPGRGAYLCPLRECWQRGLKGKGLERRLRVRLTPEARQRLQEFACSLPQGG